MTKKKGIEPNVSWADIIYAEWMGKLVLPTRPYVPMEGGDFLEDLRNEFKESCKGEDGVWGSPYLIDGLWGSKKVPVDTFSAEEFEELTIKYVHLGHGQQVATLSRIIMGAVAKRLKLDNSRNFKPGSKSFIYPNGMYTVTK